MFLIFPIVLDVRTNVTKVSGVSLSGLISAVVSGDNEPTVPTLCCVQTGSGLSVVSTLLFSAGMTGMLT